ncbi:uncharacterized protein BX663DRAFT_500994 [Cokeromyces recurvatus]|uniref:uncharacterized protein n=1 Tax=Cokeromyces recurvatus TaxID=90255 RepID=UPI002220E99A|nr:uncharacterized protein BX663DRAFT_500994 [Cokeromyces recurvatus]KAI7905813.1 hypothetical protein BX663DRAFT_500994 [Cokeromyces recurvatus]
MLMLSRACSIVIISLLSNSMLYYFASYTFSFFLYSYCVYLLFISSNFLPFDSKRLSLRFFFELAREVQYDY